MIVSQKDGCFLVEVDGEQVAFWISESGLNSKRDKHEIQTISFEDFLAKTERQELLFPT